jgi:hypothetical protein
MAIHAKIPENDNSNAVGSGTASNCRGKVVPALSGPPPPSPDYNPEA